MEKLITYLKRREVGEMRKRFMAWLIIIAMTVTSIPFTEVTVVRADDTATEESGESKETLYVNGTRINLDEEGNFASGGVSLLYGSAITFSAIDTDGTEIKGANFYYLKASEYQADGINNFILIEESTKLIPDSYFIAYDNGEYSRYDNSYGLVINKVSLNDPTNATIGSDMGASFDAVTNASNEVALDSDTVVNYRIDLYRGEEVVWNSSSITDTTYDLKSVIEEKGYGKYHLR